MIDGFVFYRSFYDAVKALPESEQLGFLMSLFDFALNDKEPVLTSDMQTVMFGLMRPNISAATSRYLASVENGKKGGRPRKNPPEKNLKKTQEKPNSKTQEKPKTETQEKPSEETHENLNKNINKNIFISDTSEGFKTHSDAPEVERERLLKKLEQDKAERLKKEAEEYRAAEEREAARRKAIEDAKNSMREASGGDTI